MAAKKSRSSPPKPKKRRAARPATPPTPKFVGRAASPVFDKYITKGPNEPVRLPGSLPAAPPAPAAPPRPSLATTHPAPSSPAAAATPAVGLPVVGDPAKGLIALEPPFDLDEFAGLLGQTTIRVKVPKEDLSEALRRVTDFMGFGIYVYAFSVRPAPEDQLRKFVLELTRVDFSAARGDWQPFQERGRSTSPFGPDAKG
ncbi:MAG: hypothetical protein L3K15_04330 [Thermoplasmata archaeon]|nr:hypothetical protein [Thermoplasmata archaeon]